MTNNVLEFRPRFQARRLQRSSPAIRNRPSVRQEFSACDLLRKICMQDEPFGWRDQDVAHGNTAQAIGYAARADAYPKLALVK